VRDEMEQARQTFHRLLDSATVAELSRPSNGTKWSNGQLLFHMLFGYLIVVRLLVLVRIFGRLPEGLRPHWSFPGHGKDSQVRTPEV
jgi:hypothetical protein